MAHLTILGYCPPDVHEEFITEVNHWRYKAEGKYRKGTISPFVSELKFYDVRIPEELIPEFLRDLGAQTPENLATHFTRVNPKRKFIIKLLLWIYKKLTPFKEPKIDTGNLKYKLGSWHNFYVFGQIKDDIGTNILTGEKREVL